MSALSDMAPTAWITRHCLDPNSDPAQLTPELIIDLLRFGRRSIGARKGWARRRKDWDGYLSMYGHADVLIGFARIADELAGPEYSRLLGQHVWGSPDQFEPRWLWADLLRRHPNDSEAMMSSAERRALVRLPDDITVYRGAGNEAYIPRFSWTLDRGQAEWFAQRFAGEDSAEALRRLSRIDPNHESRPVVASGQIAKLDVIAYIDGRAEREIVALPESVRINNVHEV